MESRNLTTKPQEEITSNQTTTNFYARRMRTLWGRKPNTVTYSKSRSSIKLSCPALGSNSLPKNVIETTISKQGVIQVKAITANARVYIIGKNGDVNRIKARSHMHLDPGDHIRLETINNKASVTITPQQDGEITRFDIKAESISPSNRRILQTLRVQ